jgi:uncharacterized protein YeaO (DUF488 family)
MVREVRCRRVYDPVSDDDGFRVLVDRIWPRGLAKEDANLHSWEKDVAPSHELRMWYGHKPERFEEFKRRYIAELGAATGRAGLARLRELAEQGTLTLLTASRDLEHSQAAVLAELLREQG